MNYPTVILANGSFPSNPIVLEILNKAERLVCCDNAASKLIAYGLKPDFIVGDLDSIAPDIRSAYADKLVYMSDQETNDLTKAVDFCISEGFLELAILGATGLREDHSLANISLLADYTKILKKVNIFTDEGFFTAIFETTTFDSLVNQTVSIFSMLQNVPITTHGLKYPISNRAIRKWWEGSLNSSLTEEFTISFFGGEVVVYQSYGG